MARYGLVAKKVFGVSVKDTQLIAMQFGRDHALAQALFRRGWFEARLLAGFVEEPDVISKAEMDAWAHGFENWGDCDTAVMHCFDRSPHAWAMTNTWVKAREEFVKRAGFAMLASMALHHKAAPSPPFIKALAVIERSATDERNFVKKAVDWALRSIGSRDPACHAAALAVAGRLRADCCWIGARSTRASLPPTQRRSFPPTQCRSIPKRARRRGSDQRGQPSCGIPGVIRNAFL